MKRMLCFLNLVFVLPALSAERLDVDTIFVWDNDRGESIQARPGVAVIGGSNDGGFAAWHDARWGDYDIYRQRYLMGGGLSGPNTMVSNDYYNQYMQSNIGVTANPQNGVIVVWEDSAYHPVSEPAQIWCRVFNDDPFLVYKNTDSQKFPGIASRDNGLFGISWTSYQNEPYPSILCKFYDKAGQEIEAHSVVDHDLIKSYVPISRIAYCDSGALIVYADSSADGTARSIYGQYCDLKGAVIVTRIKLSRTAGGDTRNEQRPDAAVNSSGNMVVVWEDYRDGSADIYAQRFQALSDTFEFIGSEIPISTTVGVDELNPRVAIFADGSFVVVWFDKRNGNFDVFYRAFITGELRTRYRVPQNNSNDQLYPDIDIREGEFGTYASIVWQTRAYSNFDDVFLRNYKYNNQSGTGLDSVTAAIPLVPMSPDTGLGGRKCWYFDDENYDNPATPGWNEDPVVEPESVYIDLDSVIIDQITELNTNGQYFVVCEDTLPYNQGDHRALSAYEAIFLDLGYRTGLSSAGVISTSDQNALVDYINPPTPGDTGKPTMVDGNDFGYMYDGTALFDLYHAKYLGDGAVYTSGNIDTLYGVSGQFAKDLTMKYNYKTEVDNYVDSIIAYNGGKLLLQSSGVTDWLAGRAVCWGHYWKKGVRTPAGNTIYNSFIPEAITSSEHPHTYAEYFRRCLGFLGLQCQPEPITTLTATPGSSEGEIILNWQVVSDDSLTESAEGDYKLKFCRQKITSEAAFTDSAEEYYQTWNTADSAVGVSVAETLYGLPPCDTLVFALKVSDESGLWNTLGAEPRAVVAGDSITPHTIVIGDNYVKDFSIAYEFLNRHPANPEDSLFVTWDEDNFYLGFIGQSFVSAGDFLIYFDITSGQGADSTYPHNGTTLNCARFNAVTGEFRPDFCFILETYNAVRLYECTGKERGRDAWTLRNFHGSYSEDNIINGYNYTEISVPFTDLGYNTSNPFKLVVTIQEETTNKRTHVYPVYNPVDTFPITQYYQWSHLGDSLIPNQTVNVIGIEEKEEFRDAPFSAQLLTCAPNPFKHSINFYIAYARSSEPPVVKIYNIAGRMVRELKSELNVQSFIYHTTWDGKDKSGRNVAQGVYFCELFIGEERTFNKIVLLR